MTDVDLAEYLPLHGDRLALRKFCQSRPKNETRKCALLERLRKKVKIRHELSTEESGSESEGRVKRAKTSKPLQGNVNAAKEKRRVDIGWIISDSQGSKQIRTKQGGGTRKIKINRLGTKQDLLNEGKLLFFPHGLSSHGPEEQFDFDVWDFAENSIDDKTTISDLYDRLKFGIIRVYLATKRKLISSESVSPDPNPTDTDTLTEDTATIQDSAENNMLSAAVGICRIRSLDEIEFLSGDCMGDLISDNQLPTAVTSTPTNPVMENTFHNTMNICIPMAADLASEREPLFLVDSPNIDTDQYTRSDNVNNTIQFGPISDIPEYGDDTLPYNAFERQHRDIIVHEGTILQDLISAFKEVDIVHADVTIRRARRANGKSEYEAGEGSGMIRDVLSEFWHEFYEQCTIGCTYKVPFTRHDFQEEEWRSVGRILLKGWNDMRYLPVSIAPIVLEECIFGVYTSDLLDVFYKYLPTTEADTLRQACDEYGSVDQDDLIEVLSSHHGRELPTEHNIKSMCLEIAKKEMIQDPRYVVDMWKDILSPMACDISLLEIQTVYRSMVPTTKSVLAFLQFPDIVSIGQENTVSHLKRLIKEMDANMLKAFLRFCTGSDLFVQNLNGIKVDFHQLHGLARRPIAHTCGCVLNLADNFKSFPEFRAEFNSVLRSGVWSMDII